MATWPLEEYTLDMEAEAILRRRWGDLASAIAELARLRTEVTLARARLEELRDLLDAAPEAMTYQLRLDVDNLCYRWRDDPTYCCPRCGDPLRPPGWFRGL